MTKYICDACGDDLKLSDKELHVSIAFGERAITSDGKYGDCYTATLCEECAKRLHRWVGTRTHYNFKPCTTPTEAMTAFDLVTAYKGYCDKYSQSRTKKCDAFKLANFVSQLKNDIFQFDGKELRCRVLDEDKQQ